MNNEKPNILWICTDQQRWDTLGCYGNPYVSTPNIDRLAGEGTLFENAYCQSPVCTPSRASFLTGRYPRTTRCRQNGQNIPAEETLVTRLLADAGYSCGLSGKLHLSACGPQATPLMERRIDDGYAEFHWSHHPQEDWPTNEYNVWLRGKGKSYEPRRVEECAYVQYGPEEEDQQAAWCADKAREYIETNARYKRPWLYSVNMFAPHHPFDPPEPLLRKYLQLTATLPLSVLEEDELAGKTSFQRTDHNGAYRNARLYPYSRMTENDHRHIRAAYWAMIEMIDNQVGRLLEVLERTGQRERTLVIFMSDHGELLGDHGLYLKGPHFYEPSVHVPLIVSQPGTIKAGQTIRSLVELTDIAPTLLQAAGLPIYSGMQGRSLLPLLQGGEDKHRDDVYCESYHFYNDEDRGDSPLYAVMVRSERYKLVMYHTAGDGELYDLQSDPGEVSNLWNDPQSLAAKLAMMERLCRRVAATVDPMPQRLAEW